MASIYILFPKEHPDLVVNALRHFHWAVERFEAISTRNSLAKAALGVLRAIDLRLKRSLGMSGQAAQRLLAAESSLTSPAGGTGSSSSSGTTASSVWDSPNATSTLPQHPQTHRNSSSSGSTSTSSHNPAPLEFNFNLDPQLFPAGDNNSVATGGGAFDWNPPSGFDWSSLQPIHATCDLVYHDLIGTGPRGSSHGEGQDNAAWGYLDQPQPQQHACAYDKGGGTTVIGADGVVGLTGGPQEIDMAQYAAAGTVSGEERNPGFAVCHFEGHFAEDSVWSLLNQYAPI